MLAAAALAMGLALTACGGDGADKAGDGGTKDVVMWMYPIIIDEQQNTDFWKKTQDEFNKQNKDINLKIELVPWDGADEKVATAIAGGQGPDLVLVTPDQALNYYSTGGLKPVDKALEASKDKFLPNALDSVTFDDGKIYGVPIYHTSTSTVYNKKVLEEAGITALPKTWDDLKAAAPKLAEKDIAVIDYSAAPEASLNLTFYPLL